MVSRENFAVKKMVAPFQKLKGAAFDRRYLQEMIAGHTKAIEIFKKEASNAQKEDLKAYASQTLPTLQKDLDDAKGVTNASTALNNSATLFPPQ